MTFTDEQQKEHCETFIHECRQKAWTASCNADYIVKQLDDLTADYTKLKADDNKLAEEIKALETALYSHTKDNRDKRKTLQERRTALSKKMEFLLMTHSQGQKSLAALYQSVETNLALAKHAETWAWKETTSNNPPN